jgi:DeoR/GlpR family transcriptional regulator of sugar metabolism
VRVPLHLVEARRQRVARLLQQNRYMPVQELCRRLGISEATARRDLAALARENRITRTYGGAFVDFNLRFPSFQQRQQHAAAAKRRIAAAARRLIQPGQTLFLDVGTTVFAIAQILQERPVAPLTVVTCSLPVADALAGLAGLHVHLPGGEFFRRQSVLMGDLTLRILGEWTFDLAFMSAEGLDAQGLWNSQEDVVRLQQAVLRRTGRAVMCIDAGKLGRSTPFFLSPWSDNMDLLTDASPERIAKHGGSTWHRIPLDPDPV